MKRLFLLCIILMQSVQALGSGFPTLKLGADARSGAMGMACVALSEDAAGGFWNPAGLARLNGRDVQLTMHRWIEGVNSEFIGFGQGNGKSGWGLHLLYTEVGDIEQRIVPAPNPISTFSTHELVFGLSYARRLQERVSLGITVKGLYEKIYVDEAFGVAVDLGLAWEVWEEGLRAGCVVQNLGGTTRLHEERIDLPMLARVGVAMPFQVHGSQVLLAADGVMEGDTPFHLHAGVELGWHEALYIRLGYQVGYEIRDLTGGVGFRWNGYRLDYGFMPIGSEMGDSHRLSFSFGW